MLLFSPGYVVCVATFIALLRVIGKRLRASGRAVPLLLEYYLWAYLFLGLGTISALYSAIVDVMLVSNGLDTETTADFVLTQMKAEGDSEGVLSDWRTEHSLAEYPALRYLSMVCPIFMTATYLVCAWHTYMHILKKGDDSSEDAASMRDRTIRIVLLPAVYGLMSFQGVLRMWCISINSVGAANFSNFEQRKVFLDAAYDTAFMVGDMYEAYALFVFGILILQVLRKRVNSHILVGFDVKLSLEELRTASPDVQGLLDSVKGLTVLGIKLFCLTCGAQAVYGLILNAGSYYRVLDEWFRIGVDGEPVGFFHKKEVTLATRYLFYGAGFIASCAAIGNIIEVESGFHRYLKDFAPVLKFAGTKVIVSLAFLQSIALAACPPFCFWSSTRANLFYASLLCIECFFISLAHVKAWSPEEDWYNYEVGDISVTDSESPEAEAISEN